MIKNLIISAGSMKTISSIGCVKYLEQYQMLKNVSTYVGTSAGAIMCLFLILGFSTEEIRDFLKSHIFKKGFHQLTMDELYSLEFLQTFGLDSGENVSAMIGDIIENKLQQRDITFLELSKKTGKNLVVCVANITEKESEYFCLETHPTASVMMAIRMSVSLPFIFTPVEYMGNLYVDGGIFESLPVRYIENFKDPLKDTLALRINTILSKDIPQNLFNYTINLLDAIIEKANTLATISEKVRVIDVEFEDADYMSFNFDTMNFDFNEGVIDAYIDKGFEIMMKHFEEQTP